MPPASNSKRISAVWKVNANRTQWHLYVNGKKVGNVTKVQYKNRRGIEYQGIAYYSNFGLSKVVKSKKLATAKASVVHMYKNPSKYRS